MNRVTLLVLFIALIETTSFVSSSYLPQTGPEAQLTVDDTERILCHVIVRAIRVMHVNNQTQSIGDISNQLQMDCRNLPNEELIGQCHEMVQEHAIQIFKYLANGNHSQICQLVDSRNQIAFDDATEERCESNGGDKCQCCIMHIKKRKMRFRYVIKEMTKKRLRKCEWSPRPEQCRRWIRRQEEHALEKINRICPFRVCKHLGFCQKKESSQLEPPSDLTLETYLANDVCQDFESAETPCIHLVASPESRRFTNLYLSVSDVSMSWIEQDLRQTAARARQADRDSDACAACRDVVQSSIDFYQNNMLTVRDVKDTGDSQVSEELVNQPSSFWRIQLSSDMRAVNPTSLCGCSMSTVQRCDSCVKRFQTRKDAALKAIDRLSVSQKNIFSNQQFLSELFDDMRTAVNAFDVREACAATGLCDESNTRNIDNYEDAFVVELSQGFCSILGPLESLCQQVVQGHSVDIQNVNINDNDLYEAAAKCEEAPATDDDSTGKDACQRCIHQVMEKKQCWKQRVAKYIFHMIQSCQRCPVREQCERYWKEKEACWDAKIDKICPKKVCIYMGYCQEIVSDSSALSPIDTARDRFSGGAVKLVDTA